MTQLVMRFQTDCHHLFGLILSCKCSFGGAGRPYCLMIRVLIINQMNREMKGGGEAVRRNCRWMGQQGLKKKKEEKRESTAERKRDENTKRAGLKHPQTL